MGVDQRIMLLKYGEKVRCSICGRENREISSTLGVCLSCIRDKPEEAAVRAREVHKRVRERFHLPVEPPSDVDGVRCFVCVNQCRIGEGKLGYCGLRRNKNGKLLQPAKGFLHVYYDPLPTNCCASWFCPGSKEVGYNLAVFPFGCSFNCVFCQNHEHKLLQQADCFDENSLASLSEKASCVCYFGGTPEPQLPFLLKVSRRILENQKKVRICWEWNGTGNPSLVKKAAEYSYSSDGVIKFDLKAYDKNLHVALTGRPNNRTLENFRLIAENFQRKNLLTATTLLVPGYIDAVEVEKISRFISSLNPDIPYSLLAFHPDFEMMDMPVTSKKLAMECYKTAKKYLHYVNIGNQHLLR